MQKINLNRKTYLNNKENALNANKNVQSDKFQHLLNVSNVGLKGGNINYFEGKKWDIAVVHFEFFDVLFSRNLELVDHLSQNVDP